MENAPRQRRKTDPDFSPSPSFVPSADTEYRILCPGSKIGSLIGKGGSIIKSLRQECRSKIKVEDPIPGSDERVIYICSASKDTGRSESQSVCAAQEALFRVHDRIVEISSADDEEDDEPPRPLTARLLVPNAQIGCILGKGGKIIEQMRREIGAQIRVLPKEQIPAWVSETDEMVQVNFLIQALSVLDLGSRSCLFFRS
jgi:poly(rC)-binding protein 2/3/4